MEIKGHQLIAAPRAQVWAALLDPAVLRRCLPGCDSVEPVSAEEFKVVVVSAIGPLRARFHGALKLTEADAPSSCVIVFEGQGGAVGFGKGLSSVVLEEHEGGTQLSYKAHAEVGGKLAQVGSRLIDSVARKMSDDFFKAFRQQFEAPSTPEKEASAPNVRPSSQAARPAPVSASLPAVASDQQRPVALVPAAWLLAAFALGASAAIVGNLLMK